MNSRELTIAPLNREAMDEAAARLNAIAKPLDGLGVFEKLIIQMAGITGNAKIDMKKRAILVMCADNGVVEEGVTQTDDSVTAIVAGNIARGTSSVNRMANAGGTQVFATDIGIRTPVPEAPIRKRPVRKGTRNFLKEAAMTTDEAEQAILEGISWVKECQEKGYTILGTGEMGIGNTTTSTAVGCALLGLDPQEVTGRGAGLDDAGLERKKQVIREALCKYDFYKKKELDPWEVLRHVGGLDIAGLTGVFLGGAYYHVPIVLDGLITAAAALLAARMYPKAADYMIASHLSKEPITARIMEELKLFPVVRGELALGEGTGAAMFFPLMEMALTVYQLNDTFDDMSIDAYERYGEDA